MKYSELPLHMLQDIKELKAENDVLQEQVRALVTAQEERLRRLEAVGRK